MAQADVANVEQVATVLDKVSQTMPPLRGIVHAAGVLDDGLLVNQNADRFERVFSPKVQGAWNLHSLTHGTQLDFFVLYSAGASLLGSSGQSNYAAANAFLDALAHYRRIQGLPALSINWGAWASVGMAAALGEQHQQRLLAQGINSILPQQGTKILEQLIQQDATQTAVLPIHWARLAQQFANGVIPPFLSKVAQIAPLPSTPQTQEVAEPILLRQLETAAPDEKHEIVISAIRAQVEKVLGTRLGTANRTTSRLNRNGHGLFDGSRTQ